MQKSKILVPPDDEPRDASHPERKPREEKLQAGVLPSPEIDTRTHQRYSGEGQSVRERERNTRRR